jgi:hypothetical protein
LVKTPGSGLPGAFKAYIFHRPLPVVNVNKALDRCPNLLEILEHPAIEDLLFDGPDKTLSYAIGLWLFYKGEAGCVLRTNNAA